MRTPKLSDNCRVCRTQYMAERHGGTTLQNLRSIITMLAVLCTLVLGSPLGGQAQVRSHDNGVADANLIAPIKATINRELDFGKWVINEKDAADNWVTLSDDGNNTLTWGAGVQQIAKNSHPAENGIVTVVGDPGAHFTITTTLVSITPQEGSLVLTSPLTGILDATGHATYYVGGTWTWSSNGDANDFDAKFTSVVNYD